MGRRTIKFDGKSDSVLDLDEFEPAIVRALGERRVRPLGVGASSRLLPALPELHRINTRAVVNRIAAAALRRRVSIETVDALSPRDRARLIRAIVDVNGVAADYKRLYGSYLHFDERLLVALRRSHDRVASDIRSRLMAARSRSDRIAARPDAYVIPPARYAEIARQTERMRQTLLGPTRILAQLHRIGDITRQVSRISEIAAGPMAAVDTANRAAKLFGAGGAAGVASSFSAARLTGVACPYKGLAAVTGSPYKGFSTAALGMDTRLTVGDTPARRVFGGVDVSAMKGAAMLFGTARDPAFAKGLAFIDGSSLAPLGFAAGLDRAHAGLLATVRGIGASAQIKGLYRAQFAAGIGVDSKALRMLVDGGIASQFATVKSFGMPSELLRWARDQVAPRIAAAVRARHHGELFWIVLAYQNDVALLDLQDLEREAVEEAVFTGLEVMVCDPAFATRVRGIAQASGVAHLHVQELIEGGLELACAAVVATSEGEQRKRWVNAQSSLLHAAEGLLFSELELTGKGIPRGFNVHLRDQPSVVVAAGDRAARELLTGTSFEWLLDALKGLFAKNEGGAVRHGRFWTSDPRTMTLRYLLAILTLLARHEEQAVDELIAYELGPLSPGGFRPVIDGTVTVVD